MLHDLTKYFTGDMDEIEAVEALIDTMQPYTVKQLFEAGNYIRCPNCGELAEYDEFQSDQDIMGNDIHSWMFLCGCGWHSESFELSRDRE